MSSGKDVAAERSNKRSVQMLPLVEQQKVKFEWSESDGGPEWDNDKQHSRRGGALSVECQTSSQGLQSASR